MRQIVPLAYGIGLDRAMGEYALRPGSLFDVRNVWLRDSKLSLRAGIGDPTDTLTGQVLCYGTMFRSAAKGVTIWYDPVSRDVTVYTTNLLGGDLTQVGTSAWDTLPAGAVEPPRFTAAEAFGTMLLAHDEPDVSKRLVTQVYDGTALSDLQADLDGTGAEDVVFRGVTAYLGYMVGWGFGTDGDPERPETVRISMPGDPAVFQANHYFNVGVRSVAVIGAQPSAGGLVLFKERETYLLTGTDRSTFDYRLIDAAHGCLGARASVSLNGVVYFRSRDGMRQTAGEQSQELALPLELDRPVAPGLPSNPTRTHIWYAYSAAHQAIVEGVPDFGNNQTMLYEYSLRDGLAGSRWTTSVWPVAVPHAWAMYESTETSIADPGEPDNVSFAGSQGASTASALVSWTNDSIVGDEQVEVWVRPDAGAWVQSTAVRVSGTTQSTTITTGITGSGSYDVALRMTRRGVYLATYLDPDPANWPAGAQATGSVVVIGTPSVGLVWAPGTMTASWGTPTPATAISEVRYYRVASPWNDGTNTDPTPTTITTAPGATSVGITVAAQGSTNVQVRWKVGDVAGPWSVPQAAWNGPDVVPSSLAVAYTQPFAAAYQVSWAWPGVGETALWIGERNPATYRYEYVDSQTPPSTSLTVTPPRYATCTGGVPSTSVPVIASLVIPVSGVPYFARPLGVTSATVPCS